MHMDGAVADTEEQEALLDAIGELLARHWPEGSAHKLINDQAQVSELPLWSRLAEIGVPGLPVAESRGGSGGDWRDLAAALEACGTKVVPVPALTVAGAIGALETLTGARAAALLSQVASGSTVPTLAWTQQPDLWGGRGGFTASAPQDDAVRLTGSVDLVLTPEADLVLLLADSPDGPVLAAVRTSSGGVVLERSESLDLLRPVGTLKLDGATGEVLATGGTALAALRRSLVTGAVALAAELVGVAAGCLAGAVAYAADRQQFGRPIGSFQAIKHRCADMLADVELARTAARHLAERLDGGASPDELDDAAALALLETKQVARRASAAYIQVLGGIGYTWEHEAHLYYRRAGAMSPLFGGAETHRRRLDPTRAQGVVTTPSASGYPQGSPAAELASHVERLLPQHRRTWGDDDSFAARLDWQRTLHRAGWIAPHWPEEFGGRGLGIVDQVACDRVLADFRAPELAGVLGVNNVAPTLMRYGTPDQQRHLRAIQSGDEVWCQGFSEPGAGSDLAALRTRATLDGDEFVINGQKVWTSEGMEATHCLLLARTDPDARPHRGISALLVPLDLPGITRRPIIQMTGEGGFAELFFDDVRVPRSALLGDLNDGWNVTMTTLGFERAGVIMMAGRLEREVHDIVTELAGRDLDPGLRDALADRLAETRLLSLLGRRALGRIAAGGAPGAEHSVIKLAWSLAAQAVGGTRLDALGADGLRTSLAAETQFAYLRAPATTIAGGTTEIMRNILAERVLGMPR